MYDSDAVTEDDHLFTINFDVARLPDNEKVLMNFKCDPEVRNIIL